MSPALIGVDWGTSNLRAFRLSVTGAVLEQRDSDRGLLRVTDGDFEGVLRDVAGDWLDGTPVLMCGMVGARQGWREAPYIPCPADLQSLGAGLITVLPNVRIVPGLCMPADVLRGEETQILGALDDDQPVLAITPGTHSKWARAGGGRVDDFHTYPTGELFELLRTQSILARSIAGEAHDEAAFAQGVERALTAPGLLGLLFSVRADDLLGRRAPRTAGAYLSGLLIGAEVAEGLARAHGEIPPVVVIAGPRLAGLYCTALALAGVSAVRIVDGATAAARGLWRIYEATR
jgi:2-dehydro-3-deoxygalactonokinase